MSPMSDYRLGFALSSSEQDSETVQQPRVVIVEGLDQSDVEDGEIVEGESSDIEQQKPIPLTAENLKALSAIPKRKREPSVDDAAGRDRSRNDQHRQRGRSPRPDSSRSESVGLAAGSSSGSSQRTAYMALPVGGRRLLKQYQRHLETRGHRLLTDDELKTCSEKDIAYEQIMILFAQHTMEEVGWITGNRIKPATLRSRLQSAIEFFAADRQEPPEVVLAELNASRVQHGKESMKMTTWKKSPSVSSAGGRSRESSSLRGPSSSRSPSQASSSGSRETPGNSAVARAQQYLEPSGLAPVTPRKARVLEAGETGATPMLDRMHLATAQSTASGSPCRQTRSTAPLFRFWGAPDAERNASPCAKRQKSVHAMSDMYLTVPSADTCRPSSPSPSPSPSSPSSFSTSSGGSRSSVPSRQPASKPKKKLSLIDKLRKGKKL